MLSNRAPAQHEFQISRRFCWYRAYVRETILRCVNACVNDDPDRAMMQPCQQSSAAELIEMLALAMYVSVPQSNQSIIVRSRY
jgi:hypothetical protein